MEALKFNRLLKRIKYDPDAVDSFYHEFYPKIKSRVQYRFGKLTCPEDMAQEIFMKLYTMETPNYVEAPGIWLQTFIDNYVIDKLRVSHSEAELLDSMPSDFDIERTVLAVDLKNAIAKLDKLSQQIIYMKYFEGFQLYEVADILNVSYVNVRQMASRAYKELKPYLKN